ncbi:MAG: FeoB-associated Cys-rich membrane protein [Desulfobacter sp.]|nr:MAG: FeoB-associated Cys-rich membrane protein [Desulfobacter sp.]
MENIIVGLVVAAAFAYVIKGLVKTWKGEGGCNCSGGCGGCPGSAGSCNQNPTLFK